MPTFTPRRIRASQPAPRSRRTGRMRRSPYDREILRLALPALGALAAEPLYVLVDTAIVGHLGRPQIAALGLAGTLLAGTFTIFNFLTYGTTAVVARASGAGHDRAAAGLAAQALWVALGIGVALLVLAEALGGPVLPALGGHCGSSAPATPSTSCSRSCSSTASTGGSRAPLPGRPSPRPEWALRLSAS